MKLAAPALLLDHRHAGSVYLLLSLAFSLPVTADEKPAHQPTRAESRALAYVTTHDGDDGLDAYLAATGTGRGKRHDTIVSLVKAMRASLKDGVQPGTPDFWDEVLAAVPATARSEALSTVPPDTTKTKTSQANGTAIPGATNEGKTNDPPESSTTNPAAPATKQDITDLRSLITAQNDAKANFQNYQAFFHAGVNMLNPYQITPLGDSPTRKEIAAATDTQVGGFLEFIYTNRWAWNQDRIKRTYFAGSPPPANAEAEHASDTAFAHRSGKFRSILSPPSDDGPQQGEGHSDRQELFSQWDIQFRLGYNLATSSKLTGNTLVGSSDINAELDVSVPFVADDFINGAFTVGPEFSYAATTSKNTFDVHQRIFAGFAYSTSFASPFDDDKQRRILLHSRVGWAQLANVRFVDAMSREIETFHDGTPRFFPSDAFAFETELLYPIRDYSFLTLGARIYGSHVPNPWNLYIGLTTPISSLADGLFPK